MAATTETKKEVKKFQKREKIPKKTLNEEQVKKSRQNRDKQVSALSGKAQSAINKALKAGKRPRSRKVWHTVTFRRPHTLRLKKAPKFPRFSVSKTRSLDKFQILKFPLNSETIIKLIEEQNTLVFNTALTASKKQIKSAFEKMYGTKVDKVRTAVRPTGEKKAFIRLPKDIEAVEVATKIGIC